MNRTAHTHSISCGPAQGGHPHLRLFMVLQNGHRHHGSCASQKRSCHAGLDPASKLVRHNFLRCQPDGWVKPGMRATLAKGSKRFRGCDFTNAADRIYTP